MANQIPKKVKLNIHSNPKAYHSFYFKGVFILKINLVYLFLLLNIFIKKQKITKKVNRNELKSFGKNNYGQLGVGDTENKKIPILILKGRLIKIISLGYRHTVFFDCTLTNLKKEKFNKIK